MGSAAHPEQLGQTGIVQLVQLRKCGVTGSQVYQASVAMGSKKVILCKCQLTFDRTLASDSH